MKYKFKRGYNITHLRKLLGVSNNTALANKVFYNRASLQRMITRGYYTQKFVDICEWLNADTEELFEVVE